MEINPDQQTVLEMLPEPAVVATKDGVIAFANAAAQLARRPKFQLMGTNLAELIAEPANRLRSYLAMCSRTRQFIPAAFTLKRGAGGDLRCRFEGARLSSDPNSEMLLIRQTPRTEALSGFIQLTQRVEWLNRTRHQLEAEVRERTNGLRLAQEALQRLSGELMQAQDEERRRLGRELHDSIGQLLAATQLNLGALLMDPNVPPITRERLQDTIHLTDQVIGEVRTMSYLLHPPLLDEVGLPVALENFIEGFETRSGIRVQREIPPGLSRTTPEIERAIFRIVQECLTNVHRHSSSQTAEVRLAHANGILCLEVSDQGRGIPVEVLQDGIRGSKFGVGLRGIQERARYLGGKAEFLPGNPGAVIRVTLPQKRHEAGGDSDTSLSVAPGLVSELFVKVTGN